MAETQNQSIVTVEGTIAHITYYNEYTNYAVFEVRKDNSFGTVTCVGSVPSISDGESVRIQGTTVKHPIYGKQVKITSYSSVIPHSLKAIRLYLANGNIKGIGPVTAERIIEKFGDETLDIFEKSPERLSEIKGISKKKAKEYGKAFMERTSEREAMITLAEYGIPANLAVRIFKKFKAQTISVIKENPYIIADEIFGIGFPTADKVAKKTGIAQDSPLRIQAGIIHILKQSSVNGHTYYPKSRLIPKVSELLGIQCSYDSAIDTLVKENKICIEEQNSCTASEDTGQGEYNAETADDIPDAPAQSETASEEHPAADQTAADDTKIYLNYFYYAEHNIAKRLHKLNKAKSRLRYTNIDAELDIIAGDMGITFAPQQVEAIKSAVSHGVCIITGGPGTGKTTIIKAIIHLLEHEKYDVALAAPTGKAAKRMEEATGHSAKTIHRLLGVVSMSEDEDGTRIQKFGKDDKDPLDYDAVIIDESSMIDVPLMSSLLTAVPYGTRVIFAGDCDQLPSVGPGKVFRDMIDSGCFTVCRLTQIFRQAETSDIVMNAHRINNGEYPVLFNNQKTDMFFMRRGTQESIIRLLPELILDRLPNFLPDAGPCDIQVLTPMRKSALGSVELNNYLQKVLNPPDRHKDEVQSGDRIFRTGDRVMQIRNNYELDWYVQGAGDWGVKDLRMQDMLGTGVFNGDEGEIISIDKNSKMLKVQFYDNKIAEYEFSQLDELELSYAVTIHKSQGSEYRAVIMPLLSGYPPLMSRNLLYTGLTRARELAVLVGDENMVFRMVDNKREVNRYTGLKQCILEYTE